MTAPKIVDVYPLSPLQEGLLFHAVSQPDSRAYFVQMRFEVLGALDESIFEAAWSRLCARHDVLRTSFVHEGLERPLQGVHAGRPPEIASEDLRALDAGAQQARVDEFCGQDRARGFDLAHDVLARLALFRLHEQRYALVWSYHHLLLDGWSLGLLQREFAELYAALAQGRAPALDAPRPYRDYIAWLLEADPQAANRYWATVLVGYETAAHVPPHGGEGAPAFREHVLRLDRAVSAALREVAARTGVTLSTLVQALWAVQLARYNDSADVVFGAVVSGRPAELAGVEAMVGPFINAIPVRVTLAAGEGFSELLVRLQRAALDGAPYHHARLAEISAASAPGRELFDHVLVFDNYPEVGRLTAERKGIEFRGLDVHDWTHYAFSVVVVPDEELCVKFLHDTSEYGATHVARIAGHFETAARFVAAYPQSPCDAIPLLTEGESAQLAAWSGPPVPMNGTETFIDRFEAQASRLPGAVALRYGDQSTSYGELNARANALAQRLRDVHGVRTGDRVAILLDRSEALVVAVLAALKAGASYVPLDRAYPPARIEYLLRDAGVRAVFCEPRYRGTLPAGLAIVEPPFADERAENPARAAAPEDLAYLIYTSGTTGNPKGVEISHASLLFYLDWAARWYFPADRGGSFALFSPVAFDLTVTSLFVPFLRGKPLTVLAQELEPAEIVEQIFSGALGVDAVKLTPSHVALLEYLDLRSTPVELAIVGGEAFTPHQARLLRRLNPTMRIVNEYGPTEATVGCIVYDVRGDEATMPIGTPIPGATVAILDRERRPVPAGVAGELFLGGPGLARGYRERPDLDLERFVEVAGRRMYRSGDFARRREDGTIEYLGRRDDQVKVRGHRVELGEIESALAGCAGMVHAAVVLEGAALVAYIECNSPFDGAALRDALRAALPAFMVPARFLRVSAMPLTTNGKIDRARLPQCIVASDTPAAAPRDEVERAIAAIWSEVLGSSELGRDDHFFELGGHSLKAMQVVSRMRKTLEVAMPLRDFLAEPTIAASAAFVRAAKPGPVATIARAPEQEHYPLSHAQERLWLIHRMGGEIAYNMPQAVLLEGELDASALATALRELVARHEVLRTAFVLVEGEPRQRISARGDLPLTMLDLRGERDPEGAARAVAERDATTPFALEEAPLARMTLMRVGELRHVILLTIHHIIGDGWSLNVLEQELLALYTAAVRGTASPLRPLRIAYKDFAVWQRARDFSAGEAFWAVQLEGGTQSLRLPYDARPAEEGRDFRGATLGRRVDPAIVAQLRALASKRKTTLSNLVVAAFALALWQGARQDDFCIGLSEANRDDVDLEGLIGFFVNVLPIRFRVGERETVDSLLDQTVANVYGAFEHRDYPFDLLVRRFNPERIANRQPLLNVVHGFQSFRDIRVETGASGDSALALAQPFAVPFRTSKFDLCLFVSEVGGTLLLELEYDTALFFEATIAQLAATIEACARILAEQSDEELRALTFHRGAESDAVLSRLGELNATATAYPRAASVPELFAEVARNVPEQTAVAFRHARMTYAELDARSNEVAQLLVARGVGPEEFVAVLLDRSIQMVVALLGILKAGAAYVPLSSEMPFERLREITVDTKARWLISERRQLRIANKLQWECPGLESFLCIDSDDLSAEHEDDGGIMDTAVWDYVAHEAFDDISGGGWRDSYTGEWLGRDVMDEYGENIVTKLRPLLDPQAHVLEIGCASGISMFRIAPLVERYVGTDLSPGIVRWSEGEAQRRGITNLALHALPAHEVDRVGEGEFDVVVLNSVIECFPGHSYLRTVLRKAIALMKPEGHLFLGNIWDQDLKAEFVRSLHAFKREHPERAVHAKLDRSDELFLSREFIESLRDEFPEIETIVYSTMLGAARSELSQFGFDALIGIRKGRVSQAQPAGRRRSFDRRALASVASEPLAELRPGPNSLAYMMYTSGTSGQPKGVMVEHRAIVRLVRETNYVDLGPDDAVLQGGALGFDASTFELWGPLLNGGAVVLPEGKSFLHPADLARTLRERGVTVLFLTTGLFNQIVDLDIEAFAGLNVLLTGGERASIDAFNAVRARFPALRLLHVYGPTENTTFSTFYEVRAPQSHLVPIGGPVANTTAVVVNERCEPVAFGTAGELCVGGDGLARGYWGDPVLTARKFVADPLDPQRKVYRTGDLVRWRPDGEIEFLGRIDTQIKIRGYRIELEELEGVLLRFEGVTEAAALAYQRGDGETELVAFVAGREIETEALLDHVRGALPAYLVPAQVIVVPSLPFNANGKVDRKRLVVPALVSSEAYAEPETELERRLAGIWERLLNHPRVGVSANFFALGGHSLKVARLVSMIQTELGVEVSLAAVFRAPTIRELATHMTELSRLDRRLIDDPLVALNSVQTGAPLFAFPPGSGYCLSYLRLATLLPHPVLGFSFIEADSRLDEYVAMIREAQPQGPYVLFGYSGGGKLAFRVAQELERCGERVSDLIIFDASCYLRRVTFSEAEIHEVAAEFLDEITSRVLREGALQKIKAYREFLGRCVETEAIAADIHLVVAEESERVVRDASGEPIATLDGWRELTHGEFHEQRGSGTHREMLTSPHLERNVDLLRAILARRTPALAGAP